MEMKGTVTCLLGGLMLLVASTAYAGADIQVDKSVDNIRPLSGETVEYTIVARNNGDSDAAGVKVTDQLPAGVTYISDDEPNGQFNPVTGVWDVGVVSAGGQRMLKIIALVD